MENEEIYPDSFQNTCTWLQIEPLSAGAPEHLLLASLLLFRASAHDNT